jgi:peptide deformylase
MAILKVARMGHPVLRTKAHTVPRNQVGSSRVQRLIDDMFETMQEYSGIGLAAPQVHESLRIFVAGVREGALVSPMNDDGEMPRVALVNPELTLVDDLVESDWEGCLSIPDIRGKVPRARNISVRALNRKGEPVEFLAEGLPARVIQHETDHLNGILFFDRMSSFETLAFMDEFRKYWTKDDDEDEK